jgi:hypothetical protein
LPSAVDVMAVADALDHTTIDLRRKEFIGPSGSIWSDGLRWIGGSPPFIHDDAFIRSQTSNHTVELAGIAWANNLFIGEGDNLSTNAHALNILGKTTIDGLLTDVFVDAGGKLESNVIVVQNGADLEVNGGAADTNDATIDGMSTDVFVDAGGFWESGTIIAQNGAQMGVNNGSQIVARSLSMGSGTFLSGNGGTVAISQDLVNNGTIRSQGGTFIVGGLGTNWDLDGSGDGVLSALSGDLVLQFNSPLADDFNGTIVVGQGHAFASLQPFQLGSGAEIQLNGGSTAVNEASYNANTTLSSATASIAVSGMAQMAAPFQLNAGTVNLIDNADLELGDAVIAGGNFNVATGAKVRFESTTQLSGGSFNSTGTGRAELNGATEYLGGTIQVTGLVRQDGDATVSSATTINGSGTWDLDGGGGDTVWEVNNDLTLNVARIESGAGSQIFDGRININGSGTTMTVNTSPAWSMDGRLDIDDGAVLAGSAPMNVTGTINAKTSRIESAVTFKSGSTVNVILARTLQLDGTTHYEGGTFRGATIQQDGAATVTTSTTLGQNTYVVPSDGGAPSTQEINWLEQFDWDGSVGDAAVTDISSGVTFTINAVEIDDNPSTDGYDGTVNINGGTLLVNTGIRLPNPGPPPGVIVPATVVPTPWRLDGTMNLQEANGNAAVVTAQYGSPLLIHGEVNALGGNATITGMAVSLLPTGRINVSNGATLNMGVVAAGAIAIDPGGLLRLNASSTLQSSVQIVIDGAVELTGSSTFRGGTYQGVGLLRQLGAANFSETTLLEVHAEFAASGTNTLAQGKELQLANSAVVEAGAIFQGDGTLRNLPGSELALLDGAELGVHLINEGIFSPGSSPGTVTVEEFSQLADAILKIEIDGADPGQFDQVIFNNPPQLGGLLDITLGDFMPWPGDSFEFLFADSFFGSFSNATIGSRFDTSDGTGSFQLDIDPMSGSLILSGFEVSVSKGDFDLDGDADGRDFLKWQRGESPKPFSASDLADWKTNFGTVTPPSTASMAVPEPASRLLLFAAGIVAYPMAARRGLLSRQLFRHRNGQVRFFKQAVVL